MPCGDAHGPSPRPRSERSTSKGVQDLGNMVHPKVSHSAWGRSLMRSVSNQPLCVVFEPWYKRWNRRVLEQRVERSHFGMAEGCLVVSQGDHVG